MPTFRNVKIKKRGGGFRLQRAMVLKSGKLKFVKNLKSSSKKRTKKRGKVTTTRGRSMARRKKRKSRKRSKRIPLSVITGLTTSILASPGGGWSPVIVGIQTNQPDLAIQSFIRAWTGIRLGGIGGQAKTEFDVFAALNPFNFDEATALKTTFWTKIATKLSRKLIGNPFGRIPIVRDWISYS